MKIRTRLREYLATLAEEYRLGLILRLVLFLVIVWLVGAAWLYLCERNWTPSPKEYALGERNWFRTFPESVRHILVYLFSGFEQYEPHTFLGWFGSVIVMLFGSLGILALLIGNVTTIVQERVHRAGFVKRKPRGARLAEHVVICNWNEKGPAIVEYLRRRSPPRKLGIVIVARGAHNIPVTNKKRFQRVWAIDGDPRDTGNLIQANVKTASAAVVLADVRSLQEANTSVVTGSLRLEDSVDGRSALVAKSIEALDAKVHTIVDLLDARNLQRFATQAVDEMIAVEEFAERYLARTAQIHGVAKVFSALLTPDPGKPFVQFVPIPVRIDGQPYSELHRRSVLFKADFVLIGFRVRESQSRWRLVLNPKSPGQAGTVYHREYLLKLGDQVVVLSRQKVNPEDLVR